MFKKLAAAAIMLTLSTAVSVSTCAGETEAASTEAAFAVVEDRQETESAAEENSKVAGKDEMAPAEDLEDENLVEVTAEDLKEGTYEIQVDSSSSMFKITECSLTVADGRLTADMTMGGKGYLYIYPGTGEEAAEAPEEDYIHYTEDENGAHVYQMDIDGLNVRTDCAAFSKKKEKWYERVLIFKPDSLPKEAYIEEAKYDQVQASIPKKSTKKVLTVGRDENGKVTEAAKDTAAGTESREDGSYTIEVALNGGSGKASVTSPCSLSVEGEKMTATIEWSSPYYDYMLVDGEKYEPVNTEGNSVFEIPVAALDEELSVTADTTAMSEPHEIEYTLTFDSGTMEKAE